MENLRSVQMQDWFRPSMLRHPNVLARVKYRTDGHCYYCGATADLGIDHVRATARGGSDHIANLVMACRTCNSSKCASGLAHFRHNVAIRLCGFPLPFTRRHVEWARGRGLDLTDYDNFLFWFEANKALLRPPQTRRVMARDGTLEKIAA